MVVFTEPVGASPPSHLFWPGVTHPRLAYSRPRVLSGVSSDTRCPATLTSLTILDTLDTYKTAIAYWSLDIRWRHVRVDASSSRLLLLGSARKTGDTGCSEQGG